MRHPPKQIARQRLLQPAEGGVFCGKQLSGGGCVLQTTGPGGYGTGFAAEEGYQLIGRAPEIQNRKEPPQQIATLQGEGYGGGYNEPPIVNFEGYEILNDLVLTVDVWDGVLANDEDYDGPDPLEAHLFESPTHGVLTLNLDGSFQYDPNDTYVGDDFFSYTAWDGADHSEVMSVYLVVNGLEIEFVDGAGSDSPSSPDWVEVTDLTTSAWVGEEINLRTTITGIPIWNFATAHEWMIPSQAIAWWGNQDVSGNFLPPNTQHAEVFDITQDMIDAEEITFYFVDGGTKVVDVGVTVNNQVSVVRSTTFSINRPATGLNVSTTDINIFVQAPDDIVQFANATTDGMTFTATGDPSPGQFKFVQLGQGTVTRNDGTTGQVRTHPFGLDTSFPYSALLAPNVAVDSPFEALKFGYVHYNGHDTFTMYSMWQSNKAGAIMVPLKSVDWWWSFDVTRNGVLWDWTPGVTTPLHSTVHTVVDTTDHPEWNDNMMNTQWVTP